MLDAAILIVAHQSRCVQHHLDISFLHLLNRDTSGFISCKYIKIDLYCSRIAIYGDVIAGVIRNIFIDFIQYSVDLFLCV
jgi:hypothetical protein